MRVMSRRTGSSYGSGYPRRSRLRQTLVLQGQGGRRNSPLLVHTGPLLLGPESLLPHHDPRVLPEPPCPDCETGVSTVTRVFPPLYSLVSSVGGSALYPRLLRHLDAPCVSTPSSTSTSILLPSILPGSSPSHRRRLRVGGKVPSTNTGVGEYVPRYCFTETEVTLVRTIRSRCRSRDTSFWGWGGV